MRIFGLLLALVAWGIVALLAWLWVWTFKAFFPSSDDFLAQVGPALPLTLAVLATLAVPALCLVIARRHCPIAPV